MTGRDATTLDRVCDVRYSALLHQTSLLAYHLIPGVTSMPSSLSRSVGDGRSVALNTVMLPSGTSGHAPHVKADSAGASDCAAEGS